MVTGMFEILTVNSEVPMTTGSATQPNLKNTLVTGGIENAFYCAFVDVS